MEKNDFDPDQVPIHILRQRAYNFRWATVPENVIPLTAADPDFVVAEVIQKAIIDYTKIGIFSYGPPEGLPEFREVCAQVFSTRRGVSVSPEQIIAVDSAAAGMLHIVQAVLKPGDEAIVFDPVDFLFKLSVEAVGGKVKFLPFKAEDGRLDLDQLEQLVTAKTKLLGVCNPINPLGQVLTCNELTKLGDFAVSHNLWILNDEIWSEIVYDESHFVSITSLGKEIASRTITVHGFSKTFGLGGLRIGYLVAPSEDVFEKLMRASLARTTMTGASTLSQIAATAAYQGGWGWFEGFIKHLRSQRDYSVDRLSSIPGIQISKPEATYVLFPRFEFEGETSESLVKRLLDEGKVAVVPGSARWFGPGAEGHFRIVFSTSRVILKEALDRIECVLRALT